MLNKRFARLVLILCLFGQNVILNARGELNNGNKLIDDMEIITENFKELKKEEIHLKGNSLDSHEYNLLDKLKCKLFGLLHWFGMKKNKCYSRRGK